MTQGKIDLRLSTIKMFEEHKWIILIRDSSKEEWRVFHHHLSGRVMKYLKLDDAIYAMKSVQWARYRVGNAKLAKLNDLKDYENAD